MSSLFSNPIKWVLFMSFILPTILPAQMSKNDLNIIPQPAHIIMVEEGSFRITPKTVLVIENPELESIAEYFNSVFLLAAGFDLKQESRSVGFNAIELELIADSSLGNEGYFLRTNSRKIVIGANKPAGIFYGLQSLMQLLPANIFNSKAEDIDVAWRVSAVEIIDNPRFPYRGMHLDVSRHFFPASFVKKYIDLLAMHKMNRFHWHLTDDNGWRIEIKKYPKLQEISAWRVDQPWFSKNVPDSTDKADYGGFYTQEEVKEIVDYANKRFITIIPEIEMPGHSCEVLAAYPELACTEGPFYVQPGSYWPNIDILCAGNEETFEFLENVMDEVVELFPSEYIHIGGDEATKTNWEKCPLCQKRMLDEGLKNEHELQSYFIKRMEKYLNSKGKQIIGWDEILEGGLAPGATVMSWRGLDGGIQAAQQGHDVVMTPVSHCYFDYYQANPDFQPKAIGGFTTLKKVYFFDPVPEELNEQEAKHILGAQGNVWTEFIPNSKQVEYMAMPRMCALAEVVWSPVDVKNWNGFMRRMDYHKKRLRFRDVNYCEGSYQIEIATSIDTAGKILAVLKSEQFKPEIHYTLNGDDLSSDDPIYMQPIEIQKTETIKAAIFKNGELVEQPIETQIIVHKGIGKDCEFVTKPSNRYPAQGEATLVNGILGDENYRAGQWIGYRGSDMEVIIDLGEYTFVESVRLNFLDFPKAWIFKPAIVKFYYSWKGKKYKQLGEVKLKQSKANETGSEIVKYQMDYPWIETRYIKIVAENIGACPEWHPGKGQKAWMFVDEIIVE
jgi:hexosaminidase